MKTLELLRFVLAFAFLATPGLFAAAIWWPERGAGERATLGCALGLSAALIVAMFCAQWQLSFFFVAWPLLLGAMLLLWMRRTPRVSLFARPRAEDLPLAGILLVATALRFAIAIVQRTPSGWDPSFHLLLAKKLELTGRVFADWRPFEEISLHYPLGTHALLVLLSSVGSFPLERAFPLLLAAVGALSVAQVHYLAREAGQDRESSVAAAAAYGLLAIYGSVDYAQWGGLPNALGLSLFLAAATAIAGLREDALGGDLQRRAAIVAVTFAGVCFAHHHAMIVGGALLGAALLERALSGSRRSALAIFAGLAGAGVLASFFLVPFALQAREIGGTGALAYDEDFIGATALVLDLGPVFALLALGGLVLVALRKAQRLPRAVIAMSVMLGLLFVVFEYVWRIVTRMRGAEHVALTPSRFLTDGAYLLALPAGAAVAWLRRRVSAPLWAAPVVLCLLSPTNIPEWKKLFVPGQTEPFLRTCEWIRTSTPPETILLTEAKWVPYFTWRRVRETPIPASEADPAQTRKAKWIAEIDAGRIPPELEHTPILDIRELGDERGLPVIHQDQGLVVVLLHSGR